MLISDFLKAIYDSGAIPEPIEKPPVSNEEVCVLDLKMPLYGELLVIETDILQNVKRNEEVFFRLLRVACAKVKELTGHGDLDESEASQRLVTAMLSQGIYELRDENAVSEFDETKIAAYSELVELFTSHKWNSEFFNVDDLEDLRLRALIFDNYEAWINAGVQGTNVYELTYNIIRKENLIKPGSEKEIDISDILQGLDQKVYRGLEAFLFSHDESSLVRILLYTRLGLDHDILGSLRQSEKEAILKAVRGETPGLDKPVVNEATPSLNDDVVVKDDAATEGKSSVKSPRKTTAKGTPKSSKGSDETK